MIHISNFFNGEKMFKNVKIWNCLMRQLFYLTLSNWWSPSSNFSSLEKSTIEIVFNVCFVWKFAYFFQLDSKCWMKKNMNKEACSPLSYSVNQMRLKMKNKNVHRHLLCSLGLYIFLVVYLTFLVLLCYHKKFH